MCTIQILSTTLVKSRATTEVLVDLVVFWICNTGRRRPCSTLLNKIQKHIENNTGIYG